MKSKNQKLILLKSQFTIGNLNGSILLPGETEDVETRDDENITQARTQQINQHQEESHIKLKKTS